jgi:putative acyl-CoA dehydrogenase
MSEPRSNLFTHDVTNQPNPRGARDLWASDRPLQGAVALFGGRAEDLAGAGQLYGSEDILHAAHNARRDPPRLVSFARSGHRLDEVAFNDGYHRCMQAAVSQGFTATAWDGAQGGHVTHAAHVYMLSQVEPGVCCPLVMTHAAVPALRIDTALSRLWQPKLVSRSYDPRVLPVAAKLGATLGMAMTEKQGGSDVRANTTQAVRDGDVYRLRGHKWFCSAPMSDGFLTLAQAPGGLTCFLVPRWLEGARNAIQIQRLKDKLGNWANASSEIEYHDALAHRLGEEGDGVLVIIEMVHQTRLDTAMAPAGLMREALSEAKWWVEGRSAFQRRLIDQPLMRVVLADLALDHEASLAAGLFVASCYDRSDPEGQALARICVALAKFLSNKRCIPVVAEAMEVLGGMGYVEETPMPMLYREAPLNGIWEGSGNVICLDVLRTLSRDRLAEAALNDVLDGARGLDHRFDLALDAHRARWPGVPEEAEARWFVERLAVLMFAAVLLKAAPEAVAEGYVSTRVAGAQGVVPGSVSGLDTGAILARI